MGTKPAYKQPAKWFPPFSEVVEHRKVADYHLECLLVNLNTWGMWAPAAERDLVKRLTEQMYWLDVEDYLG